MDYKEDNHPVTVEEMMAFRDARAELQGAMRMKYNAPVISFSMNIPGEIKTNERIRHAFEEGLKALHCHLCGENNIVKEKSGGYEIAEEKERHEACGDEWIAAVNAQADELKELATSIEESHPFGRLFDIDVIDENGEKLSRAVPRRCLICDEEASVCARSRKHDLTELKKVVEEILTGDY